MAALSNLFAMGFYLFALYAWENVSKNKEVEDPIVDAIEEIVQKYEDSLTLYELLAHFPVDEGINCPDSDTHLPYPGDCTRYVTCRDFKAHVRGCPPGMRFDAHALHCRFQFQTSCNDTSHHDQVCGANEEYSECGPRCEESCEESHEDEYRDCSQGCVRGCFCRGGFVRGPLRMCIPPSKCRGNNMLEPWFLLHSDVKDS